MPRKRLLGRTGVMVTEVGLGGIPIMRVGFDKAERIIDRALDRGMDYIDTARVYGDSEAKFGQVMRRRRDECFLATKTVGRTADAAAAELDVSLKELQTDHLDLWQLHDVSTQALWDQVMGPGGALEAAKRARDAGRTRFIGMSAHNVITLEQAVESGEFDAILLVYNLAVSDTAGVIRKAREAGVGVAIMKPLSGGIFFGLLKDKHPGNPVTPRIAWRYVLGNEDLSVACVGAQTLRDVEEAMRASNAFLPLSGKEAAPYIAQAQGLGQDVCRDCRYCRDCPVGIDVPAMMQLMDRQRAFAYEWPRHRMVYQRLDPQADVCTKCGACEESCPFDLPIMARIEKAHAALSQPV